MNGPFYPKRLHAMNQFLTDKLIVYTLRCILKILYINLIRNNTHNSTPYSTKRNSS